MSDNAIRTPNPEDRAKRQYKPGGDGGGTPGRPSGGYSSEAHAADIVNRVSGSATTPSAPRNPPPRSSANPAIEDTPELPLEQRGVRELRRRARQLHIHNRSKMNKHELIAAIRHALR